jgi:hypothetical protein
MPEAARETVFMGTVTAMSMHEMQNILAIIRESAGLLGDIMKVNARVDFKHKPTLERTLGHISSQVDRGKGLLEATSRLAHSADADMLEACDLGVHARTLALLSERMVRLKGASVEFTPASRALPVAVGAIWVLMAGFRAVQWAVGNGAKDCVIRLAIDEGPDFHVLNVAPPTGSTPDLSGLSDLSSLLEQGRMEWDGTRLRIFFPVSRQD